MMPLEIDGVRYFFAADIAEDVGVSRQTLWRWRRTGKVPAGRRYRDKQVLFTQTEFEQIREYANRIEPLEGGEGTQLGLFNGRK
jgi:hypothetical protein